MRPACLRIVNVFSQCPCAFQQMPALRMHANQDRQTNIRLSRQEFVALLRCALRAPRQVATIAGAWPAMRILAVDAHCSRGFGPGDRSMHSLQTSAGSLTATGHLSPGSCASSLSPWQSATLKSAAAFCTLADPTMAGSRYNSLKAHALLASDACSLLRERSQSVGDIPQRDVNTRVNALADAYPTSPAISFTGWPLSNNVWARPRRQSLR